MATLLLEGCGPSGKSFTIQGEFTGMKAGELYIINPQNPAGKVDTLTIADYKFRYDGETADTVPLILLFPNALEQVIFVSPATSLKYTAAANDLKNYRVEGSEENELMNQFREAAATMNEAQLPVLAKQFITEHAASPVALYLFDRYFLQAPKVNTQEMRSLSQLLQKHHTYSPMLFAAEGRLKTAGQLAVGHKVPDVDLTLRDRNKRKLWATQKQDYTLLFFWATWIRNSYDLMWRMRQTQEQNAGRVRFVGFSLDNERFRWEDQTKRDSLTIEHSCDGLSWSSPAIQQLGLSEIPFYVIVDKSHKILCSGTTVDQLTKDVSKYVK